MRWRIERLISRELESLRGCEGLNERAFTERFAEENGIIWIVYSIYPFLLYLSRDIIFMH